MIQRKFDEKYSKIEDLMNSSPAFQGDEKYIG